MFGGLNKISQDSIYKSIDDRFKTSLPGWKRLYYAAIQIGL
jgi:hypothetical protein